MGNFQILLERGWKFLWVLWTDISSCVLTSRQDRPLTMQDTAPHQRPARLPNSKGFTRHSTHTTGEWGVISAKWAVVDRDEQALYCGGHHGIL